MISNHRVIALIGIMPEYAIRKRTLAIATGKHIPVVGEPDIWFSSVNALALVLSNANVTLLRQIDEHRPQNIAELAILSGRRKENLTIALRRMEKYGLVRMEKKGRTYQPVALFTDFEIKVMRDFTMERGVTSEETLQS